MGRIIAPGPDLLPAPWRMSAHEVVTPYGERHYCLSDTVDPQGSASTLILGLHGGSGGAQRFAHGSGLAEAFAALGHDIVFPQALSHWADGRAPLEAGWPADLAFVETMIADHGGKMPVALVGMSNGGMFAQRLSCTLRPPPAVVVSVGGALSADFAARAPAGRPVPVMIVQATEDNLIPWEGGEVPHVQGLNVEGLLLGADATAAFWLDRNRCRGEPRVLRKAIGKITVEIFAWTGPVGGADVWRVVLRGAGHRLLDHTPGASVEGTLGEFVARFVVWHIDRARLVGQVH